MAETVDDHIEICKALLGLAEPDDPRHELVKLEVAQMEQLKRKHNSPNLPRATISRLADEVGVPGEYKSLFKLFSKLVHPSALLVNSEHLFKNDWVKDILLMRLQLYAIDLLGRACDELRVPSEIAWKQLTETPAPAEYTDA